MTNKYYDTSGISLRSGVIVCSYCGKKMNDEHYIGDPHHNDNSVDYHNCDCKGAELEREERADLFDLDLLFKSKRRVITFNYDNALDAIKKENRNMINANAYKAELAQLKKDYNIKEECI